MKWLKQLFCDHNFYRIGELYKDKKGKLKKHMECFKCGTTEERNYF